MNKHLLFLFIIGIFGCTPKPEPGPEIPIFPEKEITNFPKNIILLIGNGMGLTHITAGMYQNDEPLNIQDFPITGLHQPNVGNLAVADSLAVGVAIACGLNLSKETDTLTANSILIDAKQKGKSAGILTNSDISDALPTAFIYHQNAGNSKEIIAQFFNKGVDLFIGQKNAKFQKNEKSKNYDFLKIDSDEVNFNNEKNIIGFIDSKIDNQTKTINSALKFLKNHSKNGFFLLVENNSIRDAAYKNDAMTMARSMIKFDKTIGEALNFAKTDKETLVIVTSNQEAGGFAINPGTTRDTIYDGFTTKQNTGIFLPVFSFGPGAELFEGMYENTAIYTKMKKALQLK